MLTAAAWVWGLLAFIVIVATAFVASGPGRPHCHKYQVTGVSYPPAASALFAAAGAAPPFITQVHYACPCQQPRGAISAEVGGHWTLDQARGLVKAGEVPEGGDEDGTVDKVTRGAGAPLHDK